MTKTERAELAKKHTEYMDKQYKQFINTSIKCAEILNYEDTDVKEVDLNKYNTHIELIDTGTVEAVLKCKEDMPLHDSIVMLDFASYKNPGGGFIRGCTAQDEMICASSNLYNIISNDKFIQGFYKQNRENLNAGAYSNRHIYVPMVVVEDSENKWFTTVNVINCAAPNKSHAIRYNKSIIPKLDEAMKSRIDQVIYSAYAHGDNVLVLGAFGCGVFKNDPEFVAGVFMDLLTTKYKGVFKRVIFGIPNKESKNYLAFEKVFESEDNT